MRQTITSMLGTLPPQFFRVVISTEADNLAQLMYSVLMSGYMFANAWTRLSLTQVWGAATLPLPRPQGALRCLLGLVGLCRRRSASAAWVIP